MAYNLPMDLDPQPRRRIWLLCALAVLALILVPFALWDEAITAQVTALLHAETGPSLSAIGIVLALAADIALPVPSSLVATAAGYLLGLAGGIPTVWLGLMLGCCLGYGLGRLGGRRLLTRAEVQSAQHLVDRVGVLALIVARPVPVLAEASVMFAGITRMPPGRVLLICALSNAGIAIVYAALGHAAAAAHVFVLAFAGSIAIPALGLFLVRALAPRLPAAR